MRVLLDECLPSRLKQVIPGHDVATVSDAGWAGKSNGELLALAADTFDVFVTVDKNLPAQQNLQRLGIVAKPPARRDTPRPDDSNGRYDYWFDGGACELVTGQTVYTVDDGTRIQVDVLPFLLVRITFPDGRRVTIKQDTPDERSAS